ncbi:RDD family protein [Pseudarthrobacter sp. J75]|uniref:RDD family protein n=1 Tax=unclassified Pseudarthrobacter TaxID=2647000 RepID=UPI002E808C1A|nr:MULTISPECIES: RDD family protein [unclassified Pseudarthrobacter]MEE2521703.1 RDD family protein [Pseudarthrobacter sp. J47]MEE2527780.1 RDD family protein [Pseudarthrobacter sp. J75]MEE2569348.1 RDD family protein [Pseudarthrobacter sp. J64]
MSQEAERCPRCQQLIRPGATFCTSCGSPLRNRAARSSRNVDHSHRNHPDRSAEHEGQNPGNIPVASALAVPAQAGYGRSSNQGHSQAQGQVGGMNVAKLELVPATAGKRLGAAVLDWLPPFAVLVLAFALGFAGVTRSQSGGFIVYDTSSLVLFGGIGAGIALIYAFVMMGLEGRSGVTLGNRLMGIRSTDSDGFAPGAGPVFVRGIITGAGVFLALVAAVLVVIFRWFDTAMFILGPVMLVAVAWAVLVVISNSWDRNNKLRGWHDRAAKTLVFDVNAGRNPVATGGIQGPYTFAPLDLPPVQQVASPVAGARPAPAVINAQAPADSGTPADAGTWAPPQAPAAAAPFQAPPVQPAQPQQAQFQPQPASFQAPPVQPAQVHVAQPQAAQAPVAQFQPQPVQSQPSAHPDDDLDRTQMRGGGVSKAPVAVLRIRLDDGRDFQLDRNVLVGRNPVAQGGEQSAMVLAVDDPGRSISKTHLHLLTDGAGVWVTDRNSTNGSAVSTPDGARTPLQAGVPVFVTPGSTVHFGDRHFVVGQA